MKCLIALLLISQPQIACYSVDVLAKALAEQKYIPVQITPPYIIFENPHGREIMLLFPDAKHACPVEITRI